MFTTGIGALGARKVKHKAKPSDAKGLGEGGEEGRSLQRSEEDGTPEEPTCQLGC